MLLRLRHTIWYVGFLIFVSFEIRFFIYFLELLLRSFLGDLDYWELLFYFLIVLLVNLLGGPHVTIFIRCFFISDDG